MADKDFFSPEVETALQGMWGDTTISVAGIAEKLTEQFNRKYAASTVSQKASRMGLPKRKGLSFQLWQDKGKGLGAGPGGAGSIAAGEANRARAVARTQEAKRQARAPKTPRKASAAKT